jgi:hypothetical protein
MFGTLFGQFVGGVLWGVGATLASSVVRDGNTEGLRDITKLAVKTYLTAADRLQTTADEVRQNIDLLVAEVESELATQNTSPAA